METILDSQMLVISNTAVRSHMPSPRAPKIPFSCNEDTDIDTVHKSLGSLSLGAGVVGAALCFQDNVCCFVLILRRQVGEQETFL